MDGIYFFNVRFVQDVQVAILVTFLADQSVFCSFLTPPFKYRLISLATSTEVTPKTKYRTRATTFVKTVPYHVVSFWEPWQEGLSFVQRETLDSRWPMLIVPTLTQLCTVSANTSAQLFISAQRSWAFSRSRDLSLVFPCEDRTPRQHKWPVSPLVRQSDCLCWCHWDVPGTFCLLFYFLSFLSLNVHWPIITAMSRRRRQPIRSGPAGQAQPIRSRIPMVTCAGKPRRNQ